MFSSVTNSERKHVKFHTITNGHCYQGNYIHYSFKIKYKKYLRNIKNNTFLTDIKKSYSKGTLVIKFTVKHINNQNLIFEVHYVHRIWKQMQSYNNIL